MATQLAEQHDEPQPDAADAATERDFHAEAIESGWVPLEQFKGDPANHIDAEAFVKRADEIMPLLKAKLKRRDREFDELRKSLKKATAFFSDAEQRGYARAMAEITAKKEAAVADGDLAAFRAAEVEATALAKEVQKPAQPDIQEAATEAWNDWREANSWYDKGALASATEAQSDARVYADQMTERHLAKTKDMPPDEFFAMIGDLVEKKYGAQLKAPVARLRTPAAVEAPTRRGNGTAGRGWNDLPDPIAARALADRWVKSGILKTADDYLKGFDWRK